MTAKVFIVDDNYSGQDKPLGIVVDTMYFIELIDTSSKHHKAAEKFFLESSAADANLYMTSKTHEELLHRLQIYYTVEYAIQIGIDPENPIYKNGNPGFKKLQKQIMKVDPNYFTTICQQREQMLNYYKSMAEIIYPKDYNAHIDLLAPTQEKLKGCVECSDVATILIANEHEINTFATSDGGFYDVSGINIISPRKGIYTNKVSSKSSVEWVDISK